MIPRLNFALASQFVKRLLFFIPVCIIAFTGCVKGQTQPHAPGAHAIIGTWVRQEKPHLFEGEFPQQFTVLPSKMVFSKDGSLTVTFDVGTYTTTMSPLARRQAARMQTVRETYEDLGNGNLRVVYNGNLATDSYRLQGDKLYLTFPARRGMPSPTVEFHRQPH